VIASGFLDTVSTMTQVDVVEVQPEYLILRQGSLQPQREEELAHLAAYAATRVEQHVLDDLLSDRAASLNRPTCFEICKQRTSEADVVDAFMFVEGRILRGQDCILCKRRDLFEGYSRTPLREFRRQQCIVPGENASDLRRIVARFQGF